MKGYLKEMAKIFKSSSDKALKAGMVILGAGAVLASQAVQQDNASVAHAAKKHASHASHTSHTASHTASHASHRSSGSSSHASDVRQMHNAYSSYHIKHNSHDRNGAHQVDTNRHGKVTSTTTRHTDANGNTVSTITNHNKARTLRNGTNKETWISKYSNGATSHNDNWDGKHPGQSGFTDANGRTYTFKNAKANQTKTDSAGNVWTYNPVAGHWQQTIEPKHLDNTPAPSNDTPSYTPSYTPDPTPAPAPDPDPTPAPTPTPAPHPSGDTGTSTPTPAPEKPVQTGTPAPEKPAETPKTGDKKTQNGTQTFNFVDKATNKTVGTSKVNGEVGKDVPVSLKVPNGYKLVAGQKVPTSANIKDKDNPINILVEKDANPERKDGTQTIRFIDKATGKPVSKSTVGGKVGDNIAVDPKVPDGYELVPGQTLPKNVDIKATDTPIDIQVQKKGDNDKNKKPAQQTYQFIDQNGNKVVGTAVVKGNEGDHVPVTLKVPKGYHLVPGQKLPTVADLKATDKPIKILVAKDGTDGNGNADSGINGKNGKPNKGNAGNNNAGNNGAGNGNGGNGVASLPQTGNSKSNAGILAGSALVATMASLGIAYNKKKRNA